MTWYALDLHVVNKIVIVQVLSTQFTNDEEYVDDDHDHDNDDDYDANTL